MGCAESVPVMNDQDNPHEPSQGPRLQAEVDKMESARTNITPPSAAAIPTSMRRFTAAVELVATRHGFKFCLSNLTACKIIKALMDKQKEFERKSVSTRVTVGYHYTKSENLSNIQVQSLLTSEKGFIGKGLYTANNPGAFSSFDL